MTRFFLLISLLGMLAFSGACTGSEATGECDHSSECEPGLQCIDSTCQSLDDVITDTGEPDVGSPDTGPAESDGSGDDTDLDEDADADDNGDNGDNGVDCRVEPCEEGLLCDESTGHCEECVLDEQCQEYAVCNVQTSRCSCVMGYQYCDGECLSLDSVESCGSECVPCPDVEHGVATCVERSCGADCDDGYYYCDEECDGDQGQCVECLESEHCTNSDAPFCVAGSCAPCTESSHCADNEDYPVCDVDTGRCVECTMDEVDACGEYSCHPDEHECTDTVRNSVGICRTCLSDSECATHHDCVPMEFGGEPRESAYCLRRDSAGCEHPFQVLSIKESVSGAEMDIYCGVNEDVTTCEAVHDYDTGCSSADECGHPDLDDAVCSAIEMEFAPRCSYYCEPAVDEDATDECHPLYACGQLGANYCGGGI